MRGVWLPLDTDAESWRLLAFSGFLGFFVADLCLFKAFLLIGPRVSLLVQTLSPPIATIAYWLRFGDGLGPREWLAMAVTTAGVAWVVLERPGASGGSPRNGAWRLGLALAVVAAAGQALGLMLSKQGLGNYDVGAATFIRILGSMFGFIPLITLTWRWGPVLGGARNIRALTIMTFGALVGPYIGVVLCMVSLRHSHPGVTATIVNITPVLILPFVVFLYREKVTLRAVAGALVSVAGVALLLLQVHATVAPMTPPS